MAKKKPGPKPAQNVEREPSGRISRNPEATKARRETAIRTVVEARARRFGLIHEAVKRLPGESMEEFSARQGAREAMLRAITPAMRREWTGCAVGEAIADEVDVVKLWEAVKHIRGVRRDYLSALDAPGEHAKTARLPATPPGDTTEVEARVVRSEPLSDEDAVSVATARWEGLRDTLLSLHHLAVRFAIDRICAEVPGADTAPVPRVPLLAILRHVYEAEISRNTG